MIGVQADELDRLTSSVNSDITDIKVGSNALEEATQILSQTFKSSGVHGVANSLDNLCKNQNTIIKTFETYADVLKKVNVSYRNQEEEVASALKIVTKN